MNNINSSEYSLHKNVCDFLNLFFRNGLFTFINRPIKVTKSSSIIIGHVLTNTIRDLEVQGGMIKTDINNHFAVFALMKTSLIESNIKKTFKERDINEDSIKYFKSILNKIDWNLIAQTSIPDNLYNIF